MAEQKLIPLNLNDVFSQVKELGVHIASFLMPEELGQLMRVAKLYNPIAKDEALWLKKLKLHFPLLISELKDNDLNSPVSKSCSISISIPRDANATVSISEFADFSMPLSRPIGDLITELDKANNKPPLHKFFGKTYLSIYKEVPPKYRKLFSCGIEGRRLTSEISFGDLRVLEQLAFEQEEVYQYKRNVFRCAYEHGNQNLLNDFFEIASKVLGSQEQSKNEDQAQQLDINFHHPKVSHRITPPVNVTIFHWKLLCNQLQKLQQEINFQLNIHQNIIPPAYVAVACQNLPLLQFLHKNFQLDINMEYCIPLTAFYRLKTNPLLAALYGKNQAISLWLIKNGADISRIDEALAVQISPLGRALRLITMDIPQYTEVIRLLIESEAQQLPAEIGNEWKILYKFCDDFWKHLEIIKILFKHVETQPWIFPVLEKLMVKEGVGIIEYIIEAMDINICPQVLLELFQAALKDSKYIGAALYLLNNCKTQTFLNSSEIAVEDRKYIFEQAMRMQNVKLVQLLRKAGVRYANPIQYAVKNNLSLMVRCFVEADYNSNSPDKEVLDQLLVKYAFENVNEDLIKLLYEKGTQVHLINTRVHHKDGCQEQIYGLVHKGVIGITKLLLDNGADVNTAFRGRALLFAAVNNNHLELASLLIQRDAFINPSTAPDQKNACESYLACAWENNDMEMVDLLLKNGIDLALFLQQQKDLILSNKDQKTPAPAMKFIFFHAPKIDYTQRLKEWITYLQTKSADLSSRQQQDLLNFVFPDNADSNAQITAGPQ